MAMVTGRGVSLVGSGHCIPPQMPSMNKRAVAAAARSSRSLEDHAADARLGDLWA